VRLHARYVPLARERLNEADWEQAWSEGHTLTPTATRQLALEWLAAKAVQGSIDHDIPDT
jgi:hypothetical protein